MAEELKPSKPTTHLVGLDYVPEASWLDRAVATAAARLRKEVADADDRQYRSGAYPW